MFDSGWIQRCEKVLVCFTTNPRMLSQPSGVVVSYESCSLSLLWVVLDTKKGGEP